MRRSSHTFEFDLYDILSIITLGSPDSLELELLLKLVVGELGQLVLYLVLVLKLALHFNQSG